MASTTELAILAAALGSAKLVEDLLGDSAKYIGAGMKTWTEKRVNNVARIFGSAQKRLGRNLDVAGSVPPRVLKEILGEGSFCDDELSAEYFGGVLASSRSEIPRDDRGAAFARLVSSLTSYQIRTHFLLYTVIKSAFNGKRLLINRPEGPGALATYLSRRSYAECMDLSVNEDVLVIILHSFFGLQRENLIHTFISTTKKDLTENYAIDADEDGIVFQPSAFGVELFLWAHGRGDVPAWEFLNADLDQSLTLGCKPSYKTLPNRFKTSSGLLNEQ